MFVSGRAEDNRGVGFFGEGFKAGSQVHGFADYGIFEAVGGAYVAGGDLTGVNANADFQWWVAGSFVGVPVVDACQHLDCTAHGTAGVVANTFTEGRAEDDHDAVADKFVEEAAVLLYYVAHDSEITI